MVINRIKLAKALLALAEIKTDNGELIYEGELAEGVEVFVDKEGEIIPAEDGEYKTETELIVVEKGKIVKIEKLEEPVEEPKEEEPKEEVKEAEEEPVEEPKEEEPKEDEKDIRIKELEDLVAERDAIIEELTNKVKELEDKVKEQDEKLAMSVAKPAHSEYNNETSVVKGPKVNALKYFKK